jgi:hypothetical protein
MDERKAIFNKLRSLLKAYQPPFAARSDFESRYDLWSEKEVVVAGRKRKGVFFAGLIIQSRYVGFYYMPLYAEKRLRDFFKPKLLAALKGKSCFHIDRNDPKLFAQVAESLKKGFALYKKNGWI